MLKISCRQVRARELASQLSLSERYIEELLRAATLHGYLTYSPGEPDDSQVYRVGYEDSLLQGYFTYSPGQHNDSQVDWAAYEDSLLQGYFTYSPGQHDDSQVDWAADASCFIAISPALLENMMIARYTE